MNMKAAWLLVAVGFTCSVAYADQSSVGVSPSPKVVQVVGDSDIEYEPTRWPKFGTSSSDNEGCANGLRANLSEKEKSATHPGSYPAATWRAILNKSVNLTQLGLGAYKKTAKVIVSWTVRSEAYQVVINPWQNSPRLCHPWHGTINEDFPGGELATALYVNGKQVGGEAAMTFPPLGAASNYNPSDPTITGNIVLTPDMFGGEFPDTLNAEIRWINRTTGAKTKAPAYMRNMTLFIMPVTGK